MTVNIVLPDYAAVMIEAFSRLSNDDEDETQVYIQNVYAILFSLKNRPPLQRQPVKYGSGKHEKTEQVPSGHASQYG